MHDSIYLFESVVDLEFRTYNIFEKAHGNLFVDPPQNAYTKILFWPELEQERLRILFTTWKYERKSLGRVLGCCKWARGQYCPVCSSSIAHLIRQLITDAEGNPFRVLHETNVPVAALYR